MEVGRAKDGQGTLEDKMIGGVAAYQDQEVICLTGVVIMSV